MLTILSFTIHERGISIYYLWLNFSQKCFSFQPRGLAYALLSFFSFSPWVLCVFNAEGVY